MYILSNVDGIFRIRKMKKATIITCCYNGYEFIDRCFSCIINQTYPYIEFIFVDDGSTDGSLQKAESYRIQFANRGIEFILLTETNKGAGGATALALKYVTGDYVSNYDVDDILFPQSIERRVRFLDENETYSIVRTNGYKRNQDNTTLFLVNNNEEKEKEDIFYDLLLGRTNNWAGSYMVRSNALWRVYKDRQIYESRYGQNLQILLAVAYQNKSGFIDVPLMEYSYNPNSFTNGSRGLAFEKKKLLGFKDIRLSVLEKLGIYDERIFNLLDSYYLKLLMDLDLFYGDKDDFITLYGKLIEYEKPNYIYKYHYYLVKNLRIKAFYYRLLFIIKNVTK